MKNFIEYLSKQIEAGKCDIVRLEAEGRQDDANFTKVRAFLICPGCALSSL